MMVTVVSAHLDDAVLSTANQLMQPHTNVVTLFAGQPPGGLHLTSWDRLTRAENSQQRFRERLAEDDAAMKTIGCQSARLDVPEEQYRRADIDDGYLQARLLPLVAGSAEVWAPAAIGGHPDHLIANRVSRAVLSAMSREPGTSPRLYYYADLPYTFLYGWPSWVTGRPQHDYLDVDYWLHEQLRGAGIDPAMIEPEIFSLSPAARSRKEQAVLAYRSQLMALRLDPGQAERWQALLRFEIRWRITSGSAG